MNRIILIIRKTRSLEELKHFGKLAEEITKFQKHFEKNWKIRELKSDLHFLMYYAEQQEYNHRHDIKVKAAFSRKGLEEKWRKNRKK